MKISGVRPREAHHLELSCLGHAARAHQPASSSTARSMWPCCSQSGSKTGDLFGIRMYSIERGDDRVGEQLLDERGGALRVDCG